MSGAEILAIAGGVIQIADIGARLSVKLFAFTRKAKNADKSIQGVVQEIAATGAALRELGETLEDDRYANLSSRQSLDLTSQIVADCWKVFQDINDTIGGGVLTKQTNSKSTIESMDVVCTKRPSFTFKQRLKYPFVEPQIDLLKSKLESLKSSLVLMLQVLSLAEQIRNRPKVAVAEEDRALIKSFVQERNHHEKQFQKLSNVLENNSATAQETNQDEAQGAASSVTWLPTSNSTVWIESANNHTTDTTTAGRSNDLFAASNLREMHGRRDELNTKAPPAKLGIPYASISNTSEQNTKVKTLKSVTASIDKSIIVPDQIRVRGIEIEHHAKLLDNLLQELDKVQYKIDHGTRERLQKGILCTHWEEWASIVHKHGHWIFMEMFDGYSHIVRYWTDQLDNHGYLLQGTTTMLTKSRGPNSFRDDGYRTGRQARRRRRDSESNSDANYTAIVVNSGRHHQPHTADDTVIRQPRSSERVRTDITGAPKQPLKVFLGGKRRSAAPERHHRYNRSSSGSSSHISSDESRHGGRFVRRPSYRSSRELDTTSEPRTHREVITQENGTAETHGEEQVTSTFVSSSVEDSKNEIAELLLQWTALTPDEIKRIGT